MTGSSFYAESLFPIDAVVFNAGEVRKYEHQQPGHERVNQHRDRSGEREFEPLVIAFPELFFGQRLDG